MAAKQDLERIAGLRDRLLAQGRSVPQVVEAVVARFGVSLLKAHRLARGWTRAQAVEAILATYDADGCGWRPSLTEQRLCAWEHDPRVRPGEDYLDRLCRVYETRPDRLGYGHDYTPAVELAAYAGHDEQGGEETVTDRGEFFHAVGATGLAALLERAGDTAVRLGRKLGSSNLGPATLEQLELRVVSFVQRYDHTPLDQLFPEVFAQQEQIEALLDGWQPLRQRRGLYRITGQLSLLLGLLSFELGDYLAAQTQLLAALQLAREVGDHTLVAWVRMNQSTVALWAGDFRGALDYAQDGQRYATGAMSARLAVRGEACAYARMSERSGARDALQRAERALPSQPDSGDGWWVFAPGSFQLYTGSSLLWLGEAAQAEPHMRQAVAWYGAAPFALQNPANLAQAQINLALCLVGQDQPDEGVRLAAEALGVDRVRVEPNLQQAGEFLVALPPAHRDLPAARDLAELLRSIRAAQG
ncbi:MAG: tetratricopeptide repeat protein [Egibacteraceae bacterium]